MTPEQVVIVQTTWRPVLLVGDTFAELFYGKLFTLDPDLRRLFKNDLKEQGRNLTAMISVAAGSLGRAERIVLALRELGRRHQAYGVQPQHYETVAAALLWALEKSLGEAFTPEVRGAWTEAYRLLAATMQDATRAVA